MPKEEEKEYLKILGVDKYSSESTFVLDISYALLTVHHKSVHHAGTSDLKWAMEYGFIGELRP